MSSDACWVWPPAVDERPALVVVAPFPVGFVWHRERARAQQTHLTHSTPLSSLLLRSLSPSPIPWIFLQILKYATGQYYWFIIIISVKGDHQFWENGGKKQPLEDYAIKTRIIFPRTISQEDKNSSFGFSCSIPYNIQELWRLKLIEPISVNPLASASTR